MLLIIFLVSNLAWTMIVAPALLSINTLCEYERCVPKSLGATEHAKRLRHSEAMDIRDCLVHNILILKKRFYAKYS